MFFESKEPKSKLKMRFFKVYGKTGADKFSDFLHEVAATSLKFDLNYFWRKIFF